MSTLSPGRGLPSALGWAIALFGMIATTACGDLIYFKKGGEIQAPVTIQGDRVLVQLPDATHTFRRDDFRGLVPGFVPDQEVSERFGAARSAGVTARFEAAWWALENGLVDQVIPELRALRQSDPGHVQSARMNAVLDRLDRPCSDPEIAPFRKALGISMSASRGPHILLLHQRDDDEAASRVALLEKVLTGYYLFFAAQGIELKPPERRLVVAWFNEQEDYLAFLRSQNAGAFATTRGYYHPTWNAVVSYDGRNSEAQRKGRESVAARRAELMQFEETARRLPSRARLRVTLTGESPRILGRAEAQQLVERLGREVTREELLLDLDRRAVDEGTAAHEMIHLLAANSGLLSRHDAFPRWLQEGLAMQFEVIRSGRWAGISRAHDLRLPDWRKIQPPPALGPLIRDVGYGRGYQRDAYAQAWALVYYLRIRHPGQFLTFLDWLRSPDASLSDLAPADRYMTSFRRAFGSDLESLERDWHAFMDASRTPLESHAPEASTSPDRRPPAPSRPRSPVAEGTRDAAPRGTHPG